MIPIFVIKSNAKDKNEKNATNRLVWKKEIHISTNPKFNLFFISLFSYKKRLFSPLWQRSPSHHYHQTLTSPFLPHRLTSFLWRESGELKVFFHKFWTVFSLSFFSTTPSTTHIVNVNHLNHNLKFSALFSLIFLIVLLSPLLVCPPSPPSPYFYCPRALSLNSMSCAVTIIVIVVIMIVAIFIVAVIKTIATIIIAVIIFYTIIIVFFIIVVIKTIIIIIPWIMSETVVCWSKK